MGKHDGDQGGRPKKDVDFKQVIEMCRIQCTAEEISAVLGISADTLDRRIHELYDTGFADFYKMHSEDGKISLRRLQWKAAKKGNVGMLIWLGKNMLGQKDKIENSFGDAEHIQMQLDIKSKEIPESEPLFDEELENEEPDNSGAADGSNSTTA